MIAKNFRIKPGEPSKREIPHRLAVELYDTLGEMREASEIVDAHQTYAVTDIAKNGRAVEATMYLSRRRIAVDDIAHEALHVAWAIAESESGAICKADEEMVAYTLDEIIERVWAWLARVAPPVADD